MFSAELERFAHMLEETEPGVGGAVSGKVLADLYLRLHPLAPALEMRFGTVMTALFRHADEATRLYIAERLSQADHLPAALLAFLAEAPAPYAAPVLRRARNLDPDLVARAVSSFEALRMQAIAGRDDVTGDTIDLLIACGDRTSVNILARNPMAFFDPGQIARLCARGDLLAPGARRLLDGTPPGEPPVPGLFHHLDSAGRASFLARLGDRVEAPAATGPLVPEDLRRHLAEGFVELCRHGGGEVVAAIARLAGMPRDTVRRGYEDAGGETLVVMIRACDLGERALGAALILNEHLEARSPDRLRELAALHEALPLAAARWLVAAWAGRPAPMGAFAPGTAETMPERPAAPRQSVHDPAVARPGADRRGGSSTAPRTAQPAHKKPGRKTAG